MRMKTQRILAALLSLVLLLALAPAGWAVNFEQACSITVQPAAADTEHNDPAKTKYVDDIGTATFVYDLYRVAYAKEVPGYDTYDYTLVAPFTNLDIKASAPTERNAEFWANLAQQAAKIALGLNEGSTQSTPIGATDSYTGNAMGEPFSIPSIEVTTGEGTEAAKKMVSAGLYLVITRSNDFAWNQTSDYVIEKDNVVSTLAHTNLWDYYYAPQLISIPTKPPLEGGEEDGVIKTSNPGDWNYAPVAVLKPTSEPRNGDLRIRKEVNETVDGKQYAGTKATFGYRVVATLNGKTVYDNICEITIPDQDEVTIEDKIPVGAVVTVSELYDGSRYKYKDSRIVISGDATNATLVINSSQDSPATIEFTNDNDGTPKEGYGILNTFTYNGSAWVWNNNIPIETE